jgi:triphosphoribosyl-dephospho-CoA synthetase
MTQGLVQEDFRGITPETAATTGETLYAKYGITGIRGQAAAGFPQVLQVSLPVLERGLDAGLSLNDAGCAALLAMLTETADTNLIARSDYETQQRIAREIRVLLETEPFPDPQRLQELDRVFVEKNLSPGGTADLLALTYFLYFLKHAQR